MGSNWLTEIFGADSPDYAGAARETAQGDKEAAVASNLMNNPTTYNPYGSRVWSGEVDGSGRPVMTDTLSPAMQSLFDSRTGLQQGTLDSIQRAMPNIDKALSGNYNLNTNAAGKIDSSWLPEGQGLQMGLAGEPGTIASGLDYRGLGNMPTADAQTRNAITAAMYGQAKNMLDPSYNQMQTDLEGKLVNQGITRGGEAWNREQGNLANQRQQAYNSAIEKAIIGGGDQMAQQFGLNMAARQQGVNEVNTQGNFNNQAQLQDWNQMMAEWQAGNQAVGQGFNQGLQSSVLANQATAQNNQAQTQSALLPVNVLNAVLSGSQVTDPNFQAYSQSTNIQGPNMLDAAKYQGQFNIGEANTANALTGEIVKAGAEAAKLFG